MNHLGDRLKALRKERGFTQADVAERIGLGRTAYTKIENGIQGIDAEQLAKAADFLGTTVDYLLGRSQSDQIAVDMAGHIGVLLASGRDVDKQAISTFCSLSDSEKDAVISVLTIIKKASASK